MEMIKTCWLFVFFLFLLGCAPETVTFGVLSDIHGNAKNVAYFVDVFRQRGIDAILVPGDLVDHFRNNIPDARELEEVLSVLSRAEIPVYIIPGNHEQQSIYYGVLEKTSPLFIDMSRQRYADIGDIRILSLPGYNLPEYIAKDGFLFDDVSELSRLAAPLKKNILLSHQLPRATLIDLIFSGEHVGDVQLAEVLKQKNIDILVGGHIHESGGIAETRDGAFIPQNTYTETLYLNAGSVASWWHLNGTAYKGIAVILTINKKSTMYEVIGIP